MEQKGTLFGCRWCNISEKNQPKLKGRNRERERETDIQTDQKKEREQKLKTLSEELSQRVESQVGEIKAKNQSLIENIRFAKTIQDAFESKAIQVIRKNYEVQYFYSALLICV